MNGPASIGSSSSGPLRFLLSWSGGTLCYIPASGHIEDVKSKRIVRVRPPPEKRTNGSAERIQTKKGGAPVFEPHCLTVYPGHHCNLSCPYCYVPVKSGLPEATYAPEDLRPAARFVAGHCSRRQLPFVLGFHGATEPLLYPDFIDTVIRVCREETEGRGLPLLTHCTTNGVYALGRAQWAARTFSGITLSWDGPPEVQNGQRPTPAGGATTEAVLRSALHFTRHALSLDVRVTVTAASVHRLAETVRYLHHHGVRRVACYPVYQNAAESVPESLIPDPVAFVHAFLSARIRARALGMSLTYAGTRLGDVHGPFCPPLQHNLAITPDGHLTACFLTTHGQTAEHPPLRIGHEGEPNRTVKTHGQTAEHRSLLFGHVGGAGGIETTHSQTPEHQPLLFGRIGGANGIEVDRTRLDALLLRTSRPRPECASCFNVLHCARGCPTSCPLRQNFTEPIECTIERWIGIANLLEAAGYPVTTNDLEDCEAFFTDFRIEPTAARQEHASVPA